jgi:hypothetical protein
MLNVDLLLLPYCVGVRQRKGNNDAIFLKIKSLEGYQQVRYDRLTNSTTGR